jgi:hypothetical protein
MSETSSIMADIGAKLMWVWFHAKRWPKAYSAGAGFIAGMATRLVF